MDSENPPLPNADPALMWFIRGAAVGGLLMAAINAISFFVRSSDWSGLVGPGIGAEASLGFPWVIWENGNTYGGLFVDYTNLGWNLWLAAGVGATIGIAVARRTDHLNRIVHRMQVESGDRQHQPIQFSLRGMLVVTALIAVVATLAKNFAARSETLIAIYAFGPIVLVGITMLPQRLAWQKRVMIIIPATIMLIVVAIMVGVAMGMEFDKVMMGIFLCWTPQSVLGAACLSSGMLLATSSKGAGSAAVVNEKVEDEVRVEGGNRQTLTLKLALKTLAELL